jgi:Sec-independent protein secretion pathway component TatC
MKEYRSELMYVICALVVFVLGHFFSYKEYQVLFFFFLIMAEINRAIRIIKEK